jgi:hypothetical protein
MHIPPEVAQSATSLLDYSGNWFLSHLEAAPGDFFWHQGTKALVRLFFPKLAEVDPKQLRSRIERLEAGALGMESEVQALRKRYPAYDIGPELQEPAAQEFVVDSLAAIMESPSKDKRDLLGRFIAKRLYVTTESPEELTLRQAEAMAKRMNREHLFALATLYLVHDTPLPHGLKMREANVWMDERLMPIVAEIAESEPSLEELRYLTSLGVVHYNARDTSDNLRVSNPTSAIEQTLHRGTGEMVSFGNAQHPGAFYKWAKRLYDGKPVGRGAPVLVSLAPYVLTPPGLTIAKTVLERFGADV